jgi:hypothetical protein
VERREIDRSQDIKDLIALIRTTGFNLIESLNIGDLDRLHCRKTCARPYWIVLLGRVPVNIQRAVQGSWIGCSPGGQPVKKLNEGHVKPGKLKNKGVLLYIFLQIIIYLNNPFFSFLFSSLIFVINVFFQ